MPYTEILDNCVHSIGGIKDFKIATKKTNGDPISFPLDAVYQSGRTDTIVLTDDFENRTVTIGADTFEYRYVFSQNCSYEEEEIEDRQGRFYRKVLTWAMPKTNPITQNQLKDFLFNSNGEFAIGNALVFFTDGNGQNWIGSVDLPFVLENYDTKTDARGGSNDYILRYVSNSYRRTLKYITQ